MAIRVYEYGLLRPIQNRKLVDDQIFGAHRYCNKLVELERRRRDEIAKLLGNDTTVARLTSLVVKLEDRLTRLRTKVKQKSQQAGKRTNQRVSVKWTLAALKLVRARLRPAKDVARQTMQAAIKTANHASNERRKVERAACGVYWGTYLLIEDAVDAATRQPTPPHFKPYRNEGRIGVQLQGGETVSTLFGDDTRIRIAPVPADTWSKGIGHRRRHSRTTLHLRIGSTDDRQPIWAVFPMILHRPMPEGALVKRVVVKRRMLADRERWTALITVHEPDRTSGVADGKMVAMDLGWRARGDALRVAYTMDTEGKTREILVSPDILSGLDKADSIRSIRDKLFDRARDLLVGFVKSGLMSQELLDRTKHAHAWRSPLKLTRFLAFWKQNRVAGDDDVFEWLTYWFHRNRHLWQYEAGTRKRTLLRRRETFRVLAAQLANKYQTLVLEDFNLADVAEKPAPEQADSPRDRNARAQRHAAAPSELRSVLLNAFGKDRVYVAPQNTTRRCASCDHVNDWEDQAALKLTCNNCGEVFDQDENACRNLLRAAQSSGASGTPLAAKKPGRTERLREAKAAKMAAVASGA
jgi:predicted RNA-binding Zn-ribbon protein involved in translation (DUF1610 family)